MRGTSLYSFNMHVIIFSWIFFRFMEQAREAESSPAEVRFNAEKSVTNVISEDAYCKKFIKSTSFIFCGSVLHSDQAIVDAVTNDSPMVYVKCPMFA